MSDNLREFFRGLSHANLVELLVAKYGEIVKLKDEINELRNKLKFYELSDKK